jgi:hypothetical protein
MENSKQPAFAVSREMCEMQNEIETYPYGLTKREYFAARAMQGWISCQHEGFSGENEDIVRKAIECADELLKQLGAAGKSLNF